MMGTENTVSIVAFPEKIERKNFFINYNKSKEKAS